MATNGCGDQPHAKRSPLVLIIKCMKNFNACFAGNKAGENLIKTRCGKWKGIEDRVPSKSSTLQDGFHAQTQSIEVARFTAGRRKSTAKYNAGNSFHLDFSNSGGGRGGGGRG